MTEQEKPKRARKPKSAKQTVESLVKIESFAQFLSTFLANKDVNTQALVVGAKIDKQTVYNWKHGKTFPNPNALIRLTNYLEIDIESLYPIVEQEKGQKFLETVKKRVELSN